MSFFALVFTVFTIFFLELSINSLSNIFQILGTLLVAVGFKKTFKIIINYPAMIITPMFSYWTFGPIKQDLQSTSKKKCCNNFVTKSQFIGISFWHTWINTILSIICTATGLLERLAIS